MKVIVLNFPESLYWGTTSKYHHEVNRFVIAGISPETVAGKHPYTVTTYQKLENYISMQRENENPLYPEFIDLLKQLVNDGVQIVPDYQFDRREGKQFKLDLFVRVTNHAFENGTLPVGALASEGTGAEGDAPEGNQRTWQQWVNMTRNGTVNHENETHKFFTYHTFGESRPTHDEFATILNHSASGFKLLSPNEFIAQQTEDLENA